MGPYGIYCIQLCVIVPMDIVPCAFNIIDYEVFPKIVAGLLYSARLSLSLCILYIWWVE